MRELVRDLRLMTGWRVVLCLRRGHADLKLTTPRLSIVGSTDDLREQISLVRERFKSPHFIVLACRQEQVCWSGI